ncbi:serine hydrolase [Limosilactobacillus oris]|uniref:serine hydrolase n=1 Tax=Limosilactobacillus oris TaxID=1632 RepID=UPI00388DE5D0
MIDQVLTESWQEVMASYGNPASIAVKMENGGAKYATTNAPGLRYETASTVKVAVLTMLLHITGGELDDRQETLTKQMIRYSDNDATTAIVTDYLGGMLALQSLYDELGMMETRADDWWGKTLTVPTDQLKLLQMIYYDHHDGYLNQRSKDYVKMLMHTVSFDQQWGMSAGSDDYYLKNGWRPASDNGKWEVHSMGYLPAGEQSFIIAIYTRNNRDYASGVSLIEELARSKKEVLLR